MRTFGAKDKKKRKKRKFYAGKPIKKRRKKHGKFVPYVPKRKKGDPVKVWFWEVSKMSKDGYHRWASNMRPKIKKVVFRPVGSPVLVEPSDISNKEKLGEKAIDIIQFPGTFQVRMFSHRKNTYRVSPCKKAIVKIIETEEGLKAIVSETWRMSHYWFWREK